MHNETTRYRVCMGLAFIHDRHQIHRDIKPSNLLINHAGDVKVSDFGIVRDLEGTEAKASTFVGTLTYMSPERIAGEPYDAKADIWSLGLTLVAVAQGRYPLDGGGGYWDLLHKLREEPSPSLPAATFTPEFRSFVDLCLLKDPAARPSAEALLAHPFLAGSVAAAAEAAAQRGSGGGGGGGGAAYDDDDDDSEDEDYDDEEEDDYDSDEYDSDDDAHLDGAQGDTARADLSTLTDKWQAFLRKRCARALLRARRRRRARGAKEEEEEEEEEGWGGGEEGQQQLGEDEVRGAVVEAFQPQPVAARGLSQQLGLPYRCALSLAREAACARRFTRWRFVLCARLHAPSLSFFTHAGLLLLTRPAPLSLSLSLIALHAATAT
jgi:hypothetical protein